MMKPQHRQAPWRLFSAFVLSAFMFAPEIAAAQLSPEIAVYIGTYTGTADVDADIDTSEGDGNVDSQLDTEITFTNWTPVEGSETLYYGTGTMNVDGNIMVDGEVDHLVDFQWDFTEEDHVLLDIENSTVVSQNFINIDDVAEFKLNGTFDPGGSTFTSNGDLKGDFGSGEADGTIDIDTERSSAPDFEFEVNGGTDFKFRHNTELWTFTMPEEFSGAEGSYAKGETGLSVRATSNDNVFAWWMAPSLKLPQTATDKTLLRATYTVSSNLSDKRLTPAFRFRMSSYDFQQTNELQINSTVNALLLPDPGTSRDYVHYFNFPEGTSRFRVYFDLLNFANTDAADATLYLENVVIEDVGTIVLDVPRQENVYTFRNSNTNGFVQANAGSEWAVPVLESTSAGLSARADQSIADTDQIGFWRSGETTANVRLNARRLYQARFFVTSNADANGRAAVPTFRLRLNDGSYQMASLVHVYSATEASRVPAGGTTVPYDVYFYSPPEVTNYKLLMAFDFLWFPEEGNNPNTQVNLESINIVSFVRPED